MAAQRLGISDRQCQRLLSRYRESGPLGMANRRRGKPSNNQLPDGLAQYALNIIRERYTDFRPTLACEKFAELHGVHLSKETVRSLMVKDPSQATCPEDSVATLSAGLLRRTDTD
jgi:transposase